MPKYTEFRASDKRQIKAQLAGKTHCIRYAHGASPGCSIDKSCNTELALIRSPWLFECNKLGQSVSARRLRYQNLL
jgi:hypothetical protein